MVQIIWDFVQSVECDYDVYMEERDCKELLDKIVAAGMTPPTYRNGNVLIGGRWEPEDE